MSDEGRARSRWRRALRVSAILVVSLFVLLGGAYLALDTHYIRRQVREQVLELVSELLVGELHARKLHTLGAGYIEFRDVELRDEEGRVLARIERLSAVPDWDGLLSLEVGIADVHAVGVWADLATDDEGNLRLVEAVMPVPDDAPDPPPDPDEEPLIVFIDRLRVEDGVVEIPLGEGSPLIISELAAEGSLRVDDEFTGSIEEASAAAALGETELVDIRAIRGDYTTAPGGRSTAGLELVGGGDHLIAEATLLEPPGTESGETELDGTLTLSPLTDRLLAAFGQDELADALVDHIEGEVRVAGPFDALRFEGELQLAEGSADVRLEQREDGWVGRLCVADIHLAELHVSLPGSILTTCADVFYGDRGPEGRPVRLDLSEGSLDGTPLPDSGAEGMLEEDSLRLDRFVVTDPERPDHHPVTVDGELDFDGSVNLHVVTRGLSPSREVALAELAPGFDGSVDSDLQVRITAREHGPPDMAIRGHVVARRVRGPGFSFDRAELRAHTAGAGRNQTLGLRGRLHGLEVGDFRLEDARLRLEGGPTVYALVLDTTVHDGVDVHLELDVEREGRRWKVRGGGELLRGERDWQLGLAELIASESGSVEVSGLRIAREGSAVEVDGLYGARGELGLDAALRDVSFEELHYLLTGEDLDIEGEVRGRLRVRGRDTRPEVGGELHLVDVGGYGVHDLNGDVEVAWGLNDATLTARFDAGQGGNISLDSRAVWPRPGPPDRVIRESTLTGDLHVEGFDMRFVDRLIEEELGLAGTLDGRVELSGTYEEPVVRAKVIGESIAYRDVRSARVELGAGFDDGELTFEGKLDDEYGPLARLGGSTPLRPWLDAVAADEIDPTAIPWELTLAFPERRLSTLPTIEGELGEIALRYSLGLRAASLPDTRDVSLVARARLRGNPHSGALSDPNCTRRAPVDLLFEADYRRGALAVATHFAVDRREVMAGRLNIEADLADWLREGLPDSLPETSMEMEIAGLDLGLLPVSCLYVSGPMNGRLLGEHLFSSSAQFDLRLIGTEIRLGDAPSTDFEFAARVVPDRIRVQLRDRQPGGVATLDASIPWSGLANAESEGERDEEPSPEPPSQQDISIRAHFQSYSLEPLAAVSTFIPGQAGSVEGELTLSGTPQEPTLVGEVRLIESSFFVPGVDQRLSRVTGTLRADQNSIRLVDLVAHDRTGWLEFDGRLDWRGRSAERVELNINSHAFPVRQSGIILSYLTGHTDFRGARVGDEGNAWEADLILRDLTVRLPDDTDFAVQSLDPNPDIVYVASLADVPEDAAEQVEIPGADPHIELHEGALREDEPALLLRMRTENPFWVRRTDFAVQLMADLEARVDADGFELGGEVRTERGFLEMLGKTFDVRPGKIEFNSGEEIDPALDLYATHDLASSPGDRLGVRIQGYASAPTVKFFSPDDEEITAGEALAWITTGTGSGFNEDFDSGTEASAAQQAQSVVAGLTAGILTTAARHGMGDRVPTVSVNTGSVATDVQVRAGFQASQLIPESMRGFITAMFVQGFIGTETEDGSGTEGRSVRATGGFGIELHHPHSLVTAGEYQPPANWSMEITWSP